MMKTNLLVILGLALTFLPLTLMVEIPWLPGIRGQLWNFWGVLYSGVLLLLYVFNQVKIRWPKKSLTLAWSVSLVALLLLSFFHQEPSWSAWRTLVFYILAFASYPVLEQIVARYGKATVLNMIVMITLLQAVWGITQFALQVNLGFEMIGESLVRQDVPGVAKFTSEGVEEKIIRGYGPFAHSNVLAGSLVVGLVANLGLAYLRRRLSPADFITIPLFVLGIVATFSRSGWIGCGIAVLVFGILTVKEKSTRFGLMKLAVLGAVIGLVFTPLVLGRINDPEDKGISARREGAYTAKHVWDNSNKLIGIGPGNYEIKLRAEWDRLGVNYEPWETDPVHSVPLLMLIELGWAEFLVFIGGVIYVFIVMRGREKWLLAALIPLAAFDYYLLRQPGALLPALCLVSNFQTRA